MKTITKIIAATLGLVLLSTTTQAEEINLIKPEAQKKDFYIDYSKPVNTSNDKSYKIDNDMKLNLSNKNINDESYELKSQPLNQEQFNYKNRHVSLTTGINKENEKYDFYDNENPYRNIFVTYRF